MEVQKVKHYQAQTYWQQIRVNNTKKNKNEKNNILKHTHCI